MAYLLFPQPPQPLLSTAQDTAPPSMCLCTLDETWKRFWLWFFYFVFRCLTLEKLLFFDTSSPPFPNSFLVPWMPKVCHLLISNPRHIFPYYPLGRMADDPGVPSAQGPGPEDGPLSQGADARGSTTTTTVSSTVSTAPLDVQASDQRQLPENGGNDQAATPGLLSPLAPFEDVPPPYVPRRGRPRLSIDTKVVGRTTNQRRTSMLHSDLDGAPAEGDLTLTTSVAAPPSVTVASVTPLSLSLALATQEDGQRAHRTYHLDDHNDDALPSPIPISRVLFVDPLGLSVRSPNLTHSEGVAELDNGIKDGDDDDDEHLGADFLDTPYKPPSIQRALMHREAVIFHKGHAPLFGNAIVASKST